MGLPSAIVFVLAQVAIGLWTQCLLNVLYLKYMDSTKSLTHRESSIEHTTQLHEVIGGLLGRPWRLVSFVLNLFTVFYVSFVQLLSCSNVVYFLNDTLDKRTWVCVFSTIFSLSILIPSAHNYRVWSFIGVISTIFVSGYMTVASILHDQENEKAKVSYAGTPQSYSSYFNGLSGLIVIGHVSIPIEIMDAMWKPQEYKVAYAYSMLYILLVAMPPGISMYRAFGNGLLTTTNVLSKFPDSAFRNAAIVLLIIHVFIAFGMFSLALYTIWEKLLGVHNSPSYVKRTLSRVPAFLALLLTALAFPFFGVVNRLLDSVVMTWSLYILPCVAYNAVIWGQDNEKSLSRLGWVADFSINLGIIIWMVIVECGLGIWGNLEVFLKVKDFRLFQSCYDCRGS